MKQWRKKMGNLTQVQAANLLGWSERTVKMAEKNLTDVSEVRLYQMQYFFECHANRTKPRKWGHKWGREK